MTKFTIITLLTLVLLCGCDKANAPSDYPSHFAMTTIQVPEAQTQEYYFMLDDGKSIYPSDKGRVEDYTPLNKDGKRAIVYLRFLEGVVAGYDYNAAIYSIQDVLTQSVEVAKTDEELTLLGDDGIRIETAWISGAWLNIYYRLPGNNTGDRKGRFSLVDNRMATPPSDMPNDYIYLEFRYNALDNSSDSLEIANEDYLSFRLGDYAPTEEGYKGIYLRILPPAGKEVYLQLEPVKSKS